MRTKNGRQVKIMSHVSKDSGTTSAAAIYISLFGFALIAAFLLFFANTSIWFDEANYLLISRAIAKTGYPVWGESPKLFLDNPPGLLYVISVINSLVGNNLFVLRIIYSVTSVVTPLIALFVYIRRQNLNLLLLSVSLLFCAVTTYFLMELVQIRMDLPLAALSFLALILVAISESQLKQKEPSAKLTLVLLCGVSALAFFTKYQAVCLTGTLVLRTLCDYRKPAAWLPLIAHLLGAIISISGLTILVRSNPFEPGIATLLSHVIFRLDAIGRTGVVTFDIQSHWGILKKIIPMIAVPVVVFAVVNFKARNWRSDSLLILCFLMVVVVVAFNLAVDHAPGAGGYYMIQAALPLGYIYAWSFNSVLHTRRVGAIVAMVVALAFHSILNFEVGWGLPQRFGYGWMDLVGPIGRLDQGKLVAASLAPFLRPDEMLLLDSWHYQNAGVGYWLSRSSLDCDYLLDMGPKTAENLLEQEGPRRVGSVVFSGQESLSRLRSKEWAGVNALLARDFVRSSQVENALDWTIYLRRRD
jgi:hypothetical protein